MFQTVRPNRSRHLMSKIRWNADKITTQVRSLVKLKKIKKSEKNSDCPDVIHPPAYLFFKNFLETCTTKKTTQETQY